MSAQRAQVLDYSRLYDDTEENVAGLGAPRCTAWLS